MADRKVRVHIGDDEIHRIADHIAPDRITDLAVEYLGLRRIEVQRYWVDAGNNCIRAIQSCLFAWRNRHPGPNSRKQLCEILKKAAKEKALLPADCANFLSGTVEEASVDWDQEQQWNKQGFLNPPFTLATTREWSPFPSKSRLTEIYTSLKWIHINRRPCDVVKDSLDDYWGLLSHEDLKDCRAFRILVQGDAGIGKTTVVHIMAMEWAKGGRDILKQFDFVFVIPMRDIKGGETLEDLVKANNKISSAEVVSALLSGQKHRILLILDGYDEYTPGVNTHIDDAIEKKTLWNCSILLTSRSCDKLQPIREYMNAEAQILGFSDTNINVFIGKFIGEEKVKEFMGQAKKRGITDLLNIPILLQMLCTLFVSKKKLPGNITGILRAIVELCFEREKKRLEKTWTFADVQKYLIRLGELAWAGLNKQTQQLLLSKETIDSTIGPEALQLGLLMGSDNTENNPESQWVAFHHKMIQEYISALYLVDQLQENGHQIKAQLSKLRHLFDHKVVLRFCCGLSVHAGQELLEHCAHVISNSMMDRVEHSQGPFEVNWLFDNTAHIIGTNQLIEPSIVMNWPDTVTYYLDSIVQLLKYMKSECGLSCTFNPFSNKHLYMLSQYETLPTLSVQPNLCITYKLSDTHDFAFHTDEEAMHEQTKGLMIIEPNFTTGGGEIMLKTLANLIQCLKSLVYLFMCKFQYTTENNENLGNFVRVLLQRDSYKYITLVRCKLPSIFFTHLFTCLPMYSKLEKLDLSYSTVPNESAAYLAENLPKMRNLKCLVLRECELSNDICMAVCQSLVHLVNLRILDLTKNPIGQHAQHMVTAIEKQIQDGLEVQLWGLYLKGCKIPKDIMQQLFRVWGHCPNIDRMTLIGNDMQDIVGELMSMPPPKLRGLYLQHGRITGQDVQHICAALLNKKLQHLNRLHLNLNTLKDEYVEQLIEILDNDTERGEFNLNLSDNELSEEFREKWMHATRDDLHLTWISNLPDNKKLKSS